MMIGEFSSKIDSILEREYPYFLITNFKKITAALNFLIYWGVLLSVCTSSYIVQIRWRKSN